MLQRKKIYDNIINNLMSDSKDIKKRIIKCKQGEICILYINQLTDRVMLSEFIIKPLIKYCPDNSINSVQDISENVIYADESKIEQWDENKITENVLNGMSVVIFSWQDKFLVINTKKVEKKSIDTPELTYTLRGPRDCFIENLDVNLSLIRYRIKDPQLRVQTIEVGQRTKARVAVIYINDIANDKIVNDIVQRIKNINTDGIIESGELQSFLLNNKYNILPQMGLVERSDAACGAILEGKVIVITEGSGIALVAPEVFTEFFSSDDDIYDNFFFGAFMKMLRIMALIFSFTLGAIYIALVSFHTDTLPAEYILTLATLRSNVPFNAVTGVLILETIIEILRGALIRIPKQIGGAIGIVGAIIIGQAATSSGIFSPFLLILVSLSLLSSFMAPDYSIMNSFRLLKFLMIFLTAIFGLVGFSLGICFVMTNLVSTNSFGVAYLAPYAPFDFKDSIKTFFYCKRTAHKRAEFLKTKDNTRS